MRTHRKPGGKAGKGNYQKWVAALGLACLAPAAATAAPQEAAPRRRSRQPADRRRRRPPSLKTSGLRGRGIEIVVREGVCRLTGTVPDARDEAARHLGPPARSRGSPASTTRWPSRAPAAPVAPTPAVVQVAASEPAPPSPTAPVSNQAVAQQIAVAVQQAGLNGYDMEIRFKDGACTLAGQVADQGQIDAAIAAARGVAGVGSVSNKLTVPTPAARRRPPGGLADRRDVRRAGRGRPSPGDAAAAGDDAGPDAPRRHERRHAGWFPRVPSPQPPRWAAPGCPTPANPAGAPGMGAGAVYNQASPAGLRLADLRPAPQLRGGDLPQGLLRQRLAVHRPVLPLPAGPAGLA